jgi:predicted MFS family arabinose efflux permease
MIPFRIFAPFAFGYFLSYLFRAVNAVAGPGISADLGLDPAALGLLTSVYFLAFAAIQLPLGVLLDRYPPNRVEAALLVVAATGAAVFALGGDIATLTIGRALIGLGVSACLMAAFKAYSTLVPAERLPLVNGLHMAVGGLGLLAGGLPSEAAMGLVGWRGLFLGLAALSLLEAAALFFLGRTPPTARSGATLAVQIREVGRILVSRRFLALAPAATATQAAALALQSLWVGPWMRDVAGFNPASAALILSGLALATTVGYLASGALTTALARRGYPVDAVAASGMALFVAMQAGIVLLPTDAAVWVWGGFALLSGTAILAYPALTAAFPPEQAGRVSTAVNFTSFVAAFLAQWVIGVAVAALAPGLGLAGAYGVTIAVLTTIQVATLGWYLVDRRTAFGGAMSAVRPLV